MPRIVVILLGLLMTLGCASRTQQPTVAAADVAAQPQTGGDCEEIWSRVLGPSKGRHAARMELAELGADAVPFLLSRREHPEWRVRWEVVNSLGNIGDHGATDPLIESVLLDENLHVRWRGLWALAALKDPEIPGKLEARLAAQEPSERWQTAVALAQFKRTIALPYLKAGLKDDDDWRRWEAVNGLGSIHDDETASRLAPLLNDPSDQIRREVAMTLGRIGGADAVAALIAALDHPDPQVRWRAAMGLSRHGTAESRGPLQRRLEIETHPDTRKHIEKALQKIPGE